MTDQRMVRICDLWQRKSAKGSTYFSGYAGPVQYLLFDGGRQPHPTRVGEEVHVWRLLVQERDPARRPQAQAPKPEPEVMTSRQASDRHVAELAEAFDRQGPDDVNDL